LLKDMPYISLDLCMFSTNKTQSTIMTGNKATISFSAQLKTTHPTHTISIYYTPE